MAKWCFVVCAALSAGAVLLHELVGSPLVLPPLVEAGLPADVAGLHRFSWHVGSVMTLGMAALFALAAGGGPGGRIMALVATGMSLGMACLGLGMALFGNPVMWGTPAPYVWPLLAAVAATGLLASKA